MFVSRNHKTQENWAPQGTFEIMTFELKLYTMDHFSDLAMV